MTIKHAGKSEAEMSAGWSVIVGKRCVLPPRRRHPIRLSCNQIEKGTLVTTSHMNETPKGIIVHARHSEEYRNVDIAVAQPSCFPTSHVTSYYLAHRG